MCALLSVGGRKKSKLLFRSTKIQVFKDINLIRLRDGCSGISMDLWFPVEPHMLTRSQQHTLMMHQLLSDFPRVFYPLAVVLKSFMAQNLLNSGYSGLGSYGVLLMLIRFLQWERFNAQRDGRPEETNLGKLLVSFFRLYATFDYLHKAVDVVNIPEDGGFIAKPEVLIVFPSRKPVQTGGLSSSMASGANGVAGGRKGRKKGGDDDSDDEDDAQQQHHQQQRHHDESDEEVDIQHSNVGGERESASLKKKRSNATDRFTLLILDPMDTKNQIICHHKALRNMIGAFICAIMILDPDHPAPQLMLPPTPVVVGGAQAAQADVAAGMVGGTMSASPALTAVGPGVDASKATLVPPSGGGGAASSSSATSSAPDTPLLVPQPIASLPQFPGLSATANNTQATRFHRLIEVNAARLGPQTKPCTSAQCLNPDGTSQTMCPIQNKVCFTCGHMFVKTASGASVSAPGSGSAAGGPAVQGQGQGQPHAGGGGRAAKHAGQASSTAGGLTHHPQSQQPQQGGGGGGRHGHGHSLSQMQMQMQQQMQQHPHQHQQQPHMQGQQQLSHQHRAPPMQGQHARNYIGRQPQQQQQQQAMQQQQQQPMFNAQALMAAQQLIAAQQLASQAALSQHAQAQAQAQAAAAAAASQQPLMYFNLQTQQLELVSGAGVANMPPAPLGFIPVMTGWAGAGAPQPATSASPMSMFGQQPQQQQQQAQAQGGAGGTAQNQAVSMDQAAQLANLQAMMVGLQQQQAQAQAGAQMFGYPQAVSAAAAAAASQQQQLLQQYLQLHAHPLYAGAGGVGVVPNAGDMGASSYMGGPAYSPVLSYDGLSPQYTTRTLSDSMHMGGGGASSTPPSPPTRLRGSNRASPSPQMMQQQQPQQQQQQQAGNAMQLMQQQQQQAMQLQAHLAAQAGQQQQQQQLQLPQQQQAGSRMSSGGTNGGGGGNGAPPKPSSRSNRNYNNFNGQQQPQQQTPSPRSQGYPYSQ
jgi:hypothetical protein